MDFLSSAPKLPSTSVSLNDVTDAVTSLPFDRVGSAFSSITPDLDDVSDLATVVARQGGRLGARTARTTVRTVRRYPQGIAGVLAALIALAAVGVFVKKRRRSTLEAELASKN